jgi:hypothetical protein
VLPSEHLPAEIMSKGVLEFLTTWSKSTLSHYKGYFAYLSSQRGVSTSPPEQKNGHLEHEICRTGHL